MDLTIHDEAQKIWSRITQSTVAPEQNFETNLYRKFLDYFHVGPFYYYIFNIDQIRFQYLSPEINDVLGYPASHVDPAFFMSKIHPDDQPIFLNYESTATDFLQKLPIEKLTKYKISYDYRVMNSVGKYIRILQQVVTLQHDDDKNLLLTLGVHTDISHLKTNNDSVLSFIGLDGEPSYTNVNVKEIYKSKNKPFTKREAEIVRYLLNGIQTTEIAQKLYISKHTVDSHRKNILAKTNTKNTLELAIKVIAEGLI